MFFFFSRERPAAIPIEIKSIDDTSNFDEFPDSDILQPSGSFLVTSVMLTEIHHILLCISELYNNITPLLPLSL